MHIAHTASLEVCATAASFWPSITLQQGQKSQSRKTSTKKKKQVQRETKYRMNAGHEKVFFHKMLH
jgi:hypothetical protein